MPATVIVSPNKQSSQNWYSPTFTAADKASRQAAKNCRLNALVTADGRFTREEFGVSLTSGNVTFLLYVDSVNHQQLAVEMNGERVGYMPINTDPQIIADRLEELAVEKAEVA